MTQAFGVNDILNNLKYFKDYLITELEGSSSPVLTNVLILVSLQLNNI